MRWRFTSAVAGWRNVWAGQHGFAVPTVTLMLLAATAIVGVAVTSAVQAQRGSTRDADSKAALLVAEAGVEQALLHYNRVITTPATPCLVSNGTTVAVTTPSGEWCPESTGAVNGQNFSYYVRPTDGAIEIVSTGSSDGVTRRVDVNASSSSGQQIFSDATVLARDWINLNSNANILTGVGTNGDITMSSNARICGGASVGLGRSFTAADNADWYQDYQDGACSTVLNPDDVPEEALVLPDVNQGDAVTNNDNGNFFAIDRISGAPSKVCWDGLRGNGAAGTCGSRELSLSSNSSVTLTGDTYSLCRLEMSSNTNLYVSSGGAVRIYFDSPESCGLAPGTTQLQLASNARILATSGGAANVALLFVGSDTQATHIDLNSQTQVNPGECEQNFVIYAPRTDINIDSNSTYCGAVAGKTIQIDSEATVFADASASNFTLPASAAHYVVDRFVECSNATPTGAPNEDC